MALPDQISQRDLRMRSKEIMDAVEHGQAFTVTRDGRQIAELAPAATPRRFVAREAFAAASAGLPEVDLVWFRADQVAAIDVELGDPYAR